jgi:hypothetical protein
MCLYEEYLKRLDAEGKIPPQGIHHRSARIYGELSLCLAQPEKFLKAVNAALKNGNGIFISSGQGLLKKGGGIGQQQNPFQ